MFLFWKCSPIFLFLIWPNLGSFGTFLAPRSCFWVWGQVKKIFGTHLCRQSTFVLEVQSYLFVFNLVTFGASFALFFWPFGAIFWLYGAIFGVGVRFKNIFGTSYVVNQLWFWKYSPIFFCFYWSHLGPLLHFFFASSGLFYLALLGYLWGQGHVQKHFWNPTM